MTKQEFWQGVKTRDLTLPMILDAIRTRKPLSWGRFGDGEFWCIFQHKSGRNCDQHPYYPDLGERLRDVLESRPPYYLGLQDMAVGYSKDLPEFQHLVGMNTWAPFEILHQLSIAGQMEIFFKALRERPEKIILVGNAALQKLPFDFIPVEIPLWNCWQEYGRIKKELETILTKGDVVLYSASMMSKVLIHDFHTLPIVQIDTGSVFDPYCGRRTRDYHKAVMDRDGIKEVQ